MVAMVLIHVECQSQSRDQTRCSDVTPGGVFSKVGNLKTFENEQKRKSLERPTPKLFGKFGGVYAEALPPLQIFGKPTLVCLLCVYRARKCFIIASSTAKDCSTMVGGQAAQPQNFLGSCSMSRLTQPKSDRCSPSGFHDCLV